MIVEKLEHGWLHRPEEVRLALALTHGAGSNCEAPLLVALAEAFADEGVLVLRYDLPFRVARPKGPPMGSQKRDQDGVRAAAALLKRLAPAVPLVLAGHSYGGRQTSIAASEDATLADALLLLSYPLHPPGKPDQPRTGHFPMLRRPSLFVHGTRDEFGTVEQLKSALGLIPARTELLVVTGGHGLPLNIAAIVPGALSGFLA